MLEAEFVGLHVESLCNSVIRTVLWDTDGLSWPYFVRTMYKYVNQSNALTVRRLQTVSLLFVRASCVVRRDLSDMLDLDVMERHSKASLRHSKIKDVCSIGRFTRDQTRCPNDPSFVFAWYVSFPRSETKMYMYRARQVMPSFLTAINGSHASHVSRRVFPGQFKLEPHLEFITAHVHRSAYREPSFLSLVPLVPSNTSLKNTSHLHLHAPVPGLPTTAPRAPEIPRALDHPGLHRKKA